MKPSHPSRLNKPGFTLVEILIVVTILGILAAIVVPKFTSATEDTRENSVRMNLYRIRQQIEIYYQQHDSQYPTLADFEAQMTGRTTNLGVPAANGAYGPYLQEVPNNAFTSDNVVGNGAEGSSDWYYNENTGEFLANDSAIHRTY